MKKNNETERPIRLSNRQIRFRGKAYLSIIWFLCLLTIVIFSWSARAATLSGSFTPLSSDTNINLTTTGGLDWAHWGLRSGWSIERKYGVVSQITNTFLASSGSYYSYPDGPYQFANGTNTFTWTDGTPVLAVTNTPTGVYIFGGKVSGKNPNGFQIQCPADTRMKQLRLYVGTSGAAGTLTATLSGATTYTDNSLGGGPSNGVYTIDFQADTTGQTLTVTFTSTDTSGYILLQAATLSGPDALPSAMVTAPADGSVFAAPASFTLTATASDSDGTITNLALLNGSTLLARTNSASLSTVVSNLPGGAYSFVALATDNAGLSITSFPARVFMTTGGGMLSGSVATSPSNLDLTTEGTLDWAHWGLASANSFDHKTGVSEWIPNVTPLNATTNNFLRYANNLTAYSWTDGTPTAAVSGTTTGIYIYSTNQPPGAFQLTVPATNALRRLKVYVGLYGEQARMDAWLSDWSAVPYTDSSLSSAYHSGYAVYTFLYRSTNAGATLNVRWSPEIIYDPFYGNATWQAATLSLPPTPPGLNVLDSLSSGEFDFSFLTETGANYTVWCSDSLSPANWQMLTNFPGTGGSITVSNFVTNTTARFFRVLAQ